ncbi:MULTISPECIES: cobalt-precorrin-5B (C(1))-methyltransferase CbiD [Fischerella]|uniref:Cobalt-precorrin-5B C(1)-methyltransferase n=1 Tax=Fischerella muscicola CCMEE 5323 TaxID=2019572 RepID=A0A2N6K0G2_FISMU|nr:MULTISPECIES: cobalt-precorrin-5B (C(1))-methyltransferase CbiD [Fischerella]MBD2434022.1 cobalt-precorrin-5B (C(1))-methyltransferase [Fischerella sp. FACHB-380]PLZ87546.1 cobalt-precorrin-5B (C(1))-methyltransferase [Fischerella muscicola CCMEE 5323]
MARTGYTLPVFAVAAAKAALMHLNSKNSQVSVEIDLLPGIAEIPISQVATLESHSALAITLSDPGDNLDLTRNTPIWAWVRLSPRQSQALVLEAGEGLGKTASGEAAIYSYARRLFDANLLPLIPPEQTVTVSIILPEGRQLAQRTSNEAFGILEGLSLLGTSGISQPLSAADHLEEFRQSLQTKVRDCTDLVFCIGNNGMQVAQRLGIPESAIAQTGNWIGAMLVEAGLYHANSVLLLGYQGKLIKLAGGIFNTSSHLADAKLEIISAAVVAVGGDLQAVSAVLEAKTADAAHKKLIELGLSELVFGKLAEKISHKATAYVQKYANVTLKVGTVLFDRKGEIISQDSQATELLGRVVGRWGTHRPPLP